MILTKLNYQQLQDALRFKCHHGHSGLSHPTCYEKEKNIKEKIGFIDLEFFGLNANFGIVLTWAIKPENSDKVLFDVITSKDKTDKRIVASCIKAMHGFDRLVGHYACLHYKHKVLTSDLRWVEVGSLKTGDKVIGFDEQSNGGYRRFKEASVITNELVLRDVYEITFNNGKKLIATPEHPILMLFGKQGSYVWKTVGQLKESLISKHRKHPLECNQVFSYWETDTSFEGGWLAGFADGEGYLTKGESHWRVGIGQKSGPQLDYLKQLLTDKKFKYGESINKDSNVHSIRINGGLWESVRFLGQIRPVRLLSKVDWFKNNPTVHFKRTLPLNIVSIEPAGKQMVAELGTSTKTYVGEGFLCHNSNGRCDMPYLRTRALKHGLVFPKHGEIYFSDTYPMAKNYLRLHSNRQDCISEALRGVTIKTRMSPDTWINAVIGFKKESLKYILDHNIKDTYECEANFHALLPFCKLTKTSI